MHRPAPRRASPAALLLGTLALIALLATLPAALAAQAIPPGRNRTPTASPQRPLAFGNLLPGIPTIVDPTAPGAALIDVRAANRATVRIVFFLPVALDGAQGAQLPLAYGPASAGYSLTGSVADLVAFDPTQPLTLTLPQNGRCQLYVGATARPTATQGAGAYSGTLTVEITDTGQ